MTYKWMGCYLQRGRQRGYHRPLRYYCTTTFLILGPLSLSAPVSSEGRKNISQYLTFLLIVVRGLSLQYLSLSLCVQLKVVWVSSKKVTVFVAKRACNGIKQFRIACQMFREVPLALKVFMGLKLQLNIFNAPYSFMYSNSFDNFWGVLTTTFEGRQISFSFTSTVNCWATLVSSPGGIFFLAKKNGFVSWQLLLNVPKCSHKNAFRLFPTKKCESPPEEIFFLATFLKSGSKQQLRLGSKTQHGSWSKRRRKCKLLWNTETWKWKQL